MLFYFIFSIIFYKGFNIKDKYYKQTKDEMIQEYLDSIKKDEPEEEVEIKPEKPKKLRDIIFPSISHLNKKRLLIFIALGLVIYILSLIFFPTQSATPEFDPYHDDNKHMIDRKNYFDHGEYLKNEKEE